MTPADGAVGIAVRAHRWWAAPLGKQQPVDPDEDQCQGSQTAHRKPSGVAVPPWKVERPFDLARLQRVRRLGRGGAT
jgi:hypothetical protein